MIDTLRPAEQVIFRMLLSQSPPLSISDMDLLARDYSHSFTIWDVDRTVRSDEYYKSMGQHHYLLYPEYCLSCLSRTGGAPTVRVALACPRCYSPSQHLSCHGYHRMYTLASSLGISLYGLGFDYVSQLIYSLLSIPPETYRAPDNY